MKLFGLGALVLALTACSTITVKDHQKTTSAEFNGTWVGEFSKVEPLQLSQALDGDTFDTFRCEQVVGGVTAEVSNGMITGTIQGLPTVVDFKANISSTGKIYFEEPRERRYYAASDGYYYEVPLDDDGVILTRDIGSREYHVIEGMLNASGTSEIYYRSALGMGGCRYPLSLARA